MEIPSTLSNLVFNKSAELTPIYDNMYQPSMFPTMPEQFYYNYQYNPTSIPTLNYPEYPTNSYKVFPYQPSSSLIPSQNQTVSTIKILINPFFRLRSTNQTNELPSETKQQHDSSLLSRSRSESRSPSRSPSIDRPRKKSSNKNQRNRQNRQKRKALQTKFRQEKERLNKNQTLLLSSSKFKHRRSSFDRWEHNEEKLNRLFKEYSNEDTVTQWKPLSLKDCFELYEHAYSKYHQTSI